MYFVLLHVLQPHFLDTLIPFVQHYQVGQLVVHLLLLQLLRAPPRPLRPLYLVLADQVVVP